MKKPFAWIICILILSAGCGPSLSKMTASQRGERLAEERARLINMTDPVGRTRSCITISDLLLGFVVDAVREHDIEDVNGLLDQYLTAIRAARDAMVDSKRDPERRPQGYKDLELALRAQTRLLQDVSVQLLADEREFIDRAIAVSISVREEMLGLLFPQPKPSASLLS